MWPCQRSCEWRLSGTRGGKKKGKQGGILITNAFQPAALNLKAAMQFSDVRNRGMKCIFQSFAFLKHNRIKLRFCWRRRGFYYMEINKNKYSCLWQRQDHNITAILGLPDKPSLGIGFHLNIGAVKLSMVGYTCTDQSAVLQLAVDKPEAATPKTLYALALQRKNRRFNIFILMANSHFKKKKQLHVDKQDISGLYPKAHFLLPKEQNNIRNTYSVYLKGFCTLQLLL